MRISLKPETSVLCILINVIFALTLNVQYKSLQRCISKKYIHMYVVIYCVEHENSVLLKDTLLNSMIIN